MTTKRDPATEETLPGRFAEPKEHDVTTSSSSHGRWILPTLLIVLAVATLIALTLFGGWVFLQRTERLYRGYIYPHVYALGVDLGGLSPQQAVAELEPVVDQLESGTLAFSDGEKTWTYTWADVGFHIDARTTAMDAYSIGRVEGTWRELAQVWLDYTEVVPHYDIDHDAALALLQALADEVAVPVQPATLKLEQGEVVVIPGEAGQVLDVDAAMKSILSLDQMLFHLEVPLSYTPLQPAELDPETMQAQVDPWLARSIEVQTYDVLRGQAFAWTLDGEVIASWLYLLPGSTGEPHLAVNPERVRQTLEQCIAEAGPGIGFRYDEAVDQVLNALEQGTPTVTLYMTHPERTYVVQAGDTLTRIGEKFGMPAGLIAEANPDIDVNTLTIGQELVIPSQDILTPYLPVANKRIEVSLAEQRVRVYEDGELLWDWVTSTGIADSPTHRGVFQVLSKEDEAYASQWELWMPYFIGVYDAGGGITNGFHELPILANGARLWAGTLGRPASFGCIILGIPEAETLYNWVELGVPVVIY